MKNIILFLLVLMTFSIDAKAQINSYSINDQINGVGSLSYDFDGDTQNDFTFEVIELSTNVYAARVANIGFSSYLDNSTFHYPDALNFDDTVAGSFNTGSAVLGTFTGAGLFSGAGDKYLGIKISSGVDFYYGWVLLNCNASNDTLKIISAGYSTVPDQGINAGQTVAVNSIKDFNSQRISVFPNPASDLVQVDGLDSAFGYTIMDGMGAIVQKGISIKNIDVSELATGLYFLEIHMENESTMMKIMVNK